MGVFTKTDQVVGVRILQFVEDEDAWFVVKEYVGPMVHQIYQNEYLHIVENPAFRVEWAHPATTTFDASNKQMVVWSS